MLDQKKTGKLVKKAVVFQSSTSVRDRIQKMKQDGRQLNHYLPPNEKLVEQDEKMKPDNYAEMNWRNRCLWPVPGPIQVGSKCRIVLEQDNYGKEQYVD